MEVFGWCLVCRMVVLVLFCRAFVVWWLVLVVCGMGVGGGFWLVFGMQNGGAGFVLQGVCCMVVGFGGMQNGCWWRFWLVFGM